MHDRRAETVIFCCFGVRYILCITLTRLFRCVSNLTLYGNIVASSSQRWQLFNGIQHRGEEVKHTAAKHSWRQEI